MYVYLYTCNEKSNFEDAAHGSAISDERTTKFYGCSTRDCNFLQNFSGRPAQERDSERKVNEILRMLHTVARFYSKFSGRGAERDFH